MENPEFTTIITGTPSTRSLAGADVASIINNGKISRYMSNQILYLFIINDGYDFNENYI